MIDVPGIPAPGGSKRAFPFKRNDGTLGASIVDAAKRNSPWRQNVVAAAMQVRPDKPLDGPVVVVVVFTMPRPRSHTGKRGLKAWAPVPHTSSPDATKLWRAAEDALKGVIWTDDACVWAQLVVKRYGDVPGARIIVAEWPDSGKGGA